MSQPSEHYNELYQPCGSGLIVHSNSDFELEDTQDCLTIKSPKSKLPELVIGLMIAVIGFVLIAQYAVPEFKLVIYIAGIPMLLFVGLFIYCFIGSYHKEGDWLVWDKNTGRIDFPRSSQSDTIDNFICFQIILNRSLDEMHTEITCVFKDEDRFQRYPLFLTDYFGIGSYVFNLAHLFGVHVQKVYYDGKKTVVSGFVFQTSDED